MSSIIAIDFSILSTAAVKYTDDGMEFYSFPAMDIKYYDDWYVEKKLKKFDVHKEISEVVTVSPYIKGKGSSDSYQELEIMKVVNAKELATNIINTIDIKSDDIIILEGFSYMSKGLSFIDLIEFNSIFRCMVSQIIKVDNIVVIPPTDNKKVFSGKGNADKLMMYDALMSSPYGGQFREMLEKSNGKYIDRTKRDVAKPIDDIVDAYSLLHTYILKYQ